MYSVVFELKMLTNALESIGPTARIDICTFIFVLPSEQKIKMISMTNTQYMKLYSFKTVDESVIFIIF